MNARGKVTLAVGRLCLVHDLLIRSPLSGDGEIGTWRMVAAAKGSS
jgi:hypothetical protein